MLLLAVMARAEVDLLSREAQAVRMEVLSGIVVTLSSTVTKPVSLSFFDILQQ